ncbi:MAG: GIY-YIG nuclease family protein [Lewinellaceae bacterium]|nr:GIY-YIG nuclease family protein [Lewinellaceae bacterium]
MKYVVYILESQSSGRLYIGYTNDLGRRFKEHNSNQTKSTRSKGPWTLLYAKEGLEKTEAMELERRLKNWKNRKRVLSWIEREKAT